MAVACRQQALLRWPGPLLHGIGEDAGQERAGVELPGLLRIEDQLAAGEDARRKSENRQAADDRGPGSAAVDAAVDAEVASGIDGPRDVGIDRQERRGPH